MMLQPCEPITFVAWDWKGARWCLLFDRTVDVSETWFKIEGQVGPVSMDCEGVEWIRGHHDEQSEEGIALLSAHALARGIAA